MKIIKNYLVRSSVRQTIVFLIVVLILCFIDYSSAAAKSAEDYLRVLIGKPKDYFQISYEPITLSKTEISGSQIFYGLLRGKASCIKNLPIPISEARLTFRVTGQRKGAGDQRILNLAYTINIKPFPKKKGQSYKINKQTPLQFPKASKSGDYSMVGKIIKAEIKLPLLGWRNVTNYLPQSLEFGLVKYIAGQTKKSK